MESVKPIVFISIVFLIGCAAALVPYTSDPKEKLSYARQLIDLGRPIPAEKLINESLSIYETESERSGMAAAYDVLALFYSSEAYHQQKEFYVNKGTYDEDGKKLVESLANAKTEYEEIGDLSSLSNISIRQAFYFKDSESPKESCTYFDEAESYHVKWKQQNPTQDFYILSGYESHGDMINGLKTEAGCFE